MKKMTKHPLRITADALKKAFALNGFTLYDNGEFPELERTDTDVRIFDHPAALKAPVLLMEGQYALRRQLLPYALPKMRQDGPIAAVACGKVFDASDSLYPARLLAEGIIADDRNLYDLGVLWTKIVREAFGAAYEAHLDRLGEGAAHEEKGLLWLKGRLFSADAWQSVSPVRSLIAGILLGSCAFFNGATVIGALLILCGMAVFSDGKLDYLILALSAVSVSMLQTGFFITGESFKPAFFWGFICEDKSLTGVLGYIVSISGFSILGLALAAVFMKRAEKTFLFGCLFPVCFAFLASLTPDITVNHKYIMMSQAFLTVFWAGTICRLAGKRGKKSFIPRTLTAVLMTVCLTLTGIYDFVVILKDNDKDHRVAVRMDSTLTAWLSEHLSSEDLVLTPEYSINEVTMSGLMMYLGWPYYAWSAGYDTYARAARAEEIYGTDSAHRLQEVIEQEGIDYILYETDMSFEEHECREDVIAATYNMVYQTEDGRIRIYETR